MTLDEKSTGFKLLELEDKDIITRFLKQDPPVSSELNFTNLYMWRLHYRPHWREYGDCLLIVYRPDDEAPMALPPVGKGDKGAALEAIFQEMKALGHDPVVGRASKPFVDDWVDSGRFQVAARPDQSDYVYRTQDLASLSGRKYHQKKNHLNRFKKEYIFELKEITPELVPAVLDLQEGWCELRRCAEEPSLRNEDMAVYEALGRFKDLDCRGLAITIEGKVEAFALGEPLNDSTAVIHIEKANPDVNGSYAAINYFFCQVFLDDLEFVNREQDLGVDGLRRAKESYHPHHMVDKYDIRPLG